VLVVIWRSSVRYSMKAASLAVGTLLTTPYLFMYDMTILAIPVAYLVRVGLARGFRPVELPALSLAAALMLTFIVSGAPVGLGATLIVFLLVLARCPLRRDVTAPMLSSDAGWRRDSGSMTRNHVKRAHFNR
jgi:hypothetical protein